MKYYEDKSDRKMELKLLSLSEDDKLIRECMEQASAFYGCLGKMGVTEILCDRKKAQELGADCQITAEERILKEEKSTTTAENIQYSKKFIKSKESVGIVTNNFHMFRALQIAKRQGLEDPSGIAAESTALYLPNNVLREILAEIKYLIF